MAKATAVVRKPSKRWIGKTLTARQRVAVPVISGSRIPVAEVLNGQRLRVVEVRADGWLLCRYLDDVYFKDSANAKVHSKELTVGVHATHDVGKFIVQRVQESTGAIDEIAVSDAGFAARYDLEKMPDLVGDTDCPECGEVKRAYRSRELRATMCLDCWKDILQSEDVEIPVMEGILELLDEIPDGFLDSDFGPEDRELVRTAIQRGDIENTLPNAYDISQALAQLSDAEPVSLDQIDLNVTRIMDKADTASAWVARILTPKLRQAEDYAADVEEAEELQPARATPDVVRAAREWISAKREISELKTVLARLTGRSKDLREKLSPIIRELDEQRMRIDSAVLALQQRTPVQFAGWFEAAVTLLEQLNVSFTIKAKKLLDECGDYDDWVMLERDKLVQAYSWLHSYTKRAWNWLKRTEKKITRLEQLAFYSESYSA